jgi:hypothetical protein
MPAAALPALAALLACPVCFGDPASPQGHALRLAIGFLLVVILSVLTAIALVARSWARRARELESAAQP